jgi:hypothetical protein
MSKAIRTLIIYVLWIVDLALAVALMFISRTLFLQILALFYQPGNLTFGYKVGFADKIFSIVIGLLWLTFSIASEAYYRANALKQSPLKLFARVTAPVMLCLFIVDLSLSWLQGIGGGWMRWLILAAELGIGAALLVYANRKPKQPTPAQIK